MFSILFLFFPFSSINSFPNKISKAKVLENKVIFLYNKSHFFMKC